MKGPIIPNAWRIRRAQFLLLLALCWMGCQRAPHPDFAKAYYFAGQYKLYQSEQAQSGLAMVRGFVQDSLRHPKAQKLLWWVLAAHYHKADRNWDQWKLHLDSAIGLMETERLQPQLHGWLVMLYAGRATVFYDQGLYAATLENLHQAKQLAEQYHNPAGQSEVDYYLGLVAYKEKRFAQAIKHFEEAWRNALAAKPDPILRTFYEAELLDNIGLCHYQLGQDDQAMHYYDRTLDFLQRHAGSMGETAQRSADRYHNHVANVLENKANLERMNNRLDMGKMHYENALFHAHQSQEVDSTLLSRLHNRLGRITLLQGRLAEGKMQLDSSYRYGPAQSNDFLALLHLKGGLQWSWQTGDLQKAILFQTKVDSAERAQNMRQARATQADIGNALQQKEQRFFIDRLEQKKRAQNQLVWSMAAALGLLVIALGLLYRQLMRNRQLLRSEQALHAQVKQQKAALEQAAADKEKLLRVVAHDLRSPLHGITSSLQILKPEMGLQGENEQLLDLCVQSGFNALELINELVHSQGGGNHLHLHPVLLCQLVRNTVTLLRPKAAEKKLHLHSEILGTDLWALASDQHLARVLENLVHNAIKFSHPGGRIVVRLQGQGSEALLQVADEGVGMTESFAASVLAHTANGHKGTQGEESFGLGLGICQQLMANMGGRLEVQSVLGKGTTMTVALPLLPGLGVSAKV